MTQQALQDCALNKNNKKAIIAVSAERRARLRSESQMHAEINLTKDQGEARALVSETTHAVQNAAISLQGSLMQAVTEYDTILGARAARPIALDIFLNLIAIPIPELKLLGGFAKLFMNAEKLEGVAADVMFAIEKIDIKSTLIVGGVKNPIVAAKGADAATQAAQKASQAKLAIMTPMLRSIQVAVSSMADLEHAENTRIKNATAPGIVQKVKDDYAKAGVPDTPYHEDHFTFDKLSTLILYDMMRVYAKTYCTIHIDEIESPDSIPEERDMTGLDKEQRRRIYERLGALPWLDPTRQPITCLTDFSVVWGVKIETDAEIYMHQPILAGA